MNCESAYSQIIVFHNVNIHIFYLLKEVNKMFEEDNMTLEEKKAKMFTSLLSHGEYCEKLDEFLSRKLQHGKPPVIFMELVDLFRRLNLDEVVDMLVQRDKYSIYGRPAHDPAKMIRACMMGIVHEVSFDELAKDTLRREDNALLCGFFTGEPPGCSTFYDFVERIWDGDTPNVSQTGIHGP